MAYVVCRSKLVGIGYELGYYHGTYGTYPPLSDEAAMDDPAVSWRVSLWLPTKGELAGYDVSQPWDSRHNMRLARAGVHTYSCPSDRGAQRAGRTSYLAVTGKGTVWSEVRLGQVRNPFKEVPDKIIVIEVPQSDVHWMEPRDITADEAIALYQRESGFRSGRHWRGLNFLTAGGRVYGFDEIENVEEFARRLYMHSDSENGQAQ